MALITQAEIITLAYNRKVDTSQILDYDIEMAQYRYIRPILTENLYDEVVDNVSTYTTLINTYIQPCLAYFVKYLTYNDFFIEVSDRGVKILTDQNSQTIDRSIRSDGRNDTLEKANIANERLLDYVKKRFKDNDPLYSLYRDFSNVQYESKFIGGFLIRGRNLSAEEYN